MTRRAWCAWDLEWLVRIYPEMPTRSVAAVLSRSVAEVNRKVAQLDLHKTEAYLASGMAYADNGRHPNSRASQFRPGLTPANKGTRRPGWYSGRMQETQFRKGERRGVAVDLYKPIGTERISKDGYLVRKVNDDLPLQRRWRAVHLIEWEAAHGPLPAGHAIAFRNGDKTDRSPANLELVTRRELMRRNSVHTIYPPEVRQVVQLRGALNRMIRRRTVEKQDH